MLGLRYLSCARCVRRNGCERDGGGGLFRFGDEEIGAGGNESGRKGEHNGETEACTEIELGHNVVSGYFYSS